MISLKDIRYVRLGTRDLASTAAIALRPGVRVSLEVETLGAAGFSVEP